MTTCIIERMSAASAPGLMGTNFCAFAAICVKIGSTTMTFEPASIASATKCHSWICASVILLPQIKMFFAFFRSRGSLPIHVPAHPTTRFKPMALLKSRLGAMVEALMELKNLLVKPPLIEP